jgi:hypothetical protein
MPTQRNEAVTYLKELLTVCNEMSLDSVSFEKSKSNDPTCYTVHIKGAIQDSDKQAVKEVAKKHSLAVKENLNRVVVYKPT